MDDPVPKMPDEGKGRGSVEMLRRARLLRAHAENARLMATTVAAYDRDCLLLLATDWLKAAEQLEHKSQERQGTLEPRDQALPSHAETNIG